MKNSIYLLFVIFILTNSVVMGDSTTFVNPERFSTEFMFGLRIPLSATRNDVSSGFSLRGGVGYQLTRNWEPVHLSFDFGNSSPQDPEWISYFDYHDNSYRLEQEKVNVYGILLTTRYRYQIQEQLEAYIRSGVAYYWFITSLSGSYPELIPSRKRHGHGALVEGGVYTDAFGENVLVGLITNFLLLNTKGRSLTSPNVEETPDKVFSRKDYYLSVGVSLRYYFKND